MQSQVQVLLCRDGKSVCVGAHSVFLIIFMKTSYAGGQIIIISC
jgi:hypothetical protein